MKAPLLKTTQGSSGPVTKARQNVCIGTAAAGRRKESARRSECRQPRLSGADRDQTLNVLARFEIAKLALRTERQNIRSFGQFDEDFIIDPFRPVVLSKL